MALQHFLREARADLAHGLELLTLLIPAGEQVGAKDARALALAVVGADGHEVERVRHALDVVLLHLEPVEAPPRGLIRGVHLEGLHHDALALPRHGVVDEGLDVLGIVRVHGGGKVEDAVCRCKGSAQLGTALAKRPLDEGLAVEVEQVEGEDLALDLDVVEGDVLLGALAQVLECLELARLLVVAHGLAVDDEGLRGLQHGLGELGDYVRVLARHVLGGAGKDLEVSRGRLVDLRTLPVVLVLAGEGALGEAVQHLLHALGGLGQHGRHRDARREAHMLGQLGEGPLEHLAHDTVVGGQLRVHVLDHHFRSLQRLVQGLRALLQVGRHAARVRGRGQGQGMRESSEHGLLGEADAELALRGADDVLRLGALSGHEELLELVPLLGLRLVARHLGDLLHRGQDLAYGEASGSEHEALRGTRSDGDGAQVALGLELLLDDLLLAATRLRHRLDEERVTEAQLHALVGRRQAVEGEVEAGQQVLGRALHHRTEEVGHEAGDLDALGRLAALVKRGHKHSVGHRGSRLPCAILVGVKGARVVVDDLHVLQGSLAAYLLLWLAQLGDQGRGCALRLLLLLLLLPSILLFCGRIHILAASRATRSLASAGHWARGRCRG
mmetsp:Transcript_1528/g.4314  ORF Transcript_1528/g.4314 Transcript_1528/m.4314 type:complete len:614 (-) Transcript_1528:348-2189(-)